jgi:hypothetical protein
LEALEENQPKQKDDGKMKKPKACHIMYAESVINRACCTGKKIPVINFVQLFFQKKFILYIHCLPNWQIICWWREGH